MMYYCHCAKILDITQSVANPTPPPTPQTGRNTSVLQTPPNPTDRTCDANPTPAPKTYRTAHNILGCKPPSPHFQSDWMAVAVCVATPPHPPPIRPDGSKGLCCDHSTLHQQLHSMLLRVIFKEFDALLINSSCYKPFFLNMNL